MASELIVQTIQGPSSGANANKVLIPSGHTLHAAGHVVQVQTTASPLFAILTSTTYADLLTLSFTPKFSTSLLRVDVCIRYQENGSNPNIKYKVLHDGTNIYGINYYSDYHDAATNTISSKAFHCFVNSGSISTRTIQFQAAQAASSGGTFTVNPNGDNGTETRMTITEIAG